MATSVETKTQRAHHYTRSMCECVCVCVRVCARVCVCVCAVCVLTLHASIYAC